jgi:hypothetical protein
MRKKPKVRIECFYLEDVGDDARSTANLEEYFLL